MVRILSNPYGIATFRAKPGRDPAIVPIARALIGKPFSGGAQDPAGDVQSRVILAGNLLH